MAIAMTDQQKDDLNRKGYFVVENLLGTDEVAAVAAAMDQVAAEVRAERGLGPGDKVALRNGMIRHPKLLDLMDHPAILELVVDAYGWNIHNRDSVTQCEPPGPAESDPDILSLGWHFDYEEEFCGTTVDGTLPLLDFKVGWYISDHTEPGHSTILVVPGSYRWSREQRATFEEWLDPADIVAVTVPAGSVMLWRPTLLHSVTPNLSATERKAIYVSYTPRWVRPSGHLEQDAELIARSSPVRRQLLGAMGNLSHPLGSDPVNSPNSQYWFSDDWDTVPLKAWAEARAGGPPHDWGTGLGVSHTKGPNFAFTQVTIPDGPSEGSS